MAGRIVDYPIPTHVEKVTRPGPWTFLAAGLALQPLLSVASCPSASPPHGRKGTSAEVFYFTGAAFVFRFVLVRNDPPLYTLSALVTEGKFPVWLLRNLLTLHQLAQNTNLRGTQRTLIHFRRISFTDLWIWSQAHLTDRMNPEKGWC